MFFGILLKYPLNQDALEAHSIQVGVAGSNSSLLSVISSPQLTHQPNSSSSILFKADLILRIPSSRLRLVSSAIA